ncbi:MAG TPA: hydrogenase maturation protease [Candidatus Limnocylindrales bacterium]|jgi:hydrogenase maturation protease
MSFAATTERHRPTLVIGLGNPILGDDGVGWRVVEALEDRLAGDDDARRGAGEIELDRVAIGGLSLMERLVGYERVVLVDAILGVSRPGTLLVGSLEELAGGLAGHLDSAHDAPLVEALSAGRALGARLPVEITVVGIAVQRVDVFDEHLSAAVAAAVGPAVSAILSAIGRQPVAVA